MTKIKYVELEKEAEKEKQPTQVAGYDAWSDEDKAWYDDLVQGAMDLIDEKKKLNAVVTYVIYKIESDPLIDECN